MKEYLLNMMKSGGMRWKGVRGVRMAGGGRKRNEGDGAAPGNGFSVKPWQRGIPRDNRFVAKTTFDIHLSTILLILLPNFLSGKNTIISCG